jgi:putrescine transport system permease protein
VPLRLWVRGDAIVTAEVPAYARQHERWAPFWLAWYRIGPPRWVPWLRRSGAGRWIVIGIPLLWLLLFFLAPFLIDLKISFSEKRIAIPPYSPLVEAVEGRMELLLNTDNYRFLLTDSLYIQTWLSSIKVAGISTLLCLLVGYPMALGIARAPPGQRNLLLMLVILPFWTSFLLRVYAWMGLLRNNGVINNTLISLGLIDQPIQMMQTDFAVYVGIVYAYLPFMILPLYTNLEKHDPTLLEATADLGARPLQTFARITLPLSKAGIIAGSLLVFIPAVGEYVIPSLLGRSDQLMIGAVLSNEFFNNNDWPVASAVAIVMLLLLLVPMMLLQKTQARAGAKAT